MANYCDELYQHVNQFARRLFAPPEPQYTGALCDFSGFLLPLLRDLRDLEFMPSGPVFLLLDDADYLSRLQTQILNSWIATKTSSLVSIKVSTQLRYKTFQTLSSIPIQAPHDYQQIDIADVYTSQASTYRRRVREIVAKRLAGAGIQRAPEDFFPKDDAQEARIQELAEAIHARWRPGKGGFRPADDVARYARPEYFRQLSGPSKSSNKYSYAGFDQLVDISSGVVRFFLEPAAQMFDEEREKSQVSMPDSIRPAIQNDIIRAESDRLMFSELEKIKDAEQQFVDGDSQSREADAVDARIIELQNLLRGLGGAFRAKLISESSERRVFSVAIAGAPSEDLLGVFELGVRYGYFHRSAIGNKDGTGRTRVFV